MPIIIGAGIVAVGAATNTTQQGGGTPANAIMADNGTTFLMADDGTTYLTQG